MILRQFSVLDNMIPILSNKQQKKEKGIFKRFHLIHNTSFSAGGSNLLLCCPTRRQPVIPHRRSTLPRPRCHRMSRILWRWLRLIRAVRHLGAMQSGANGGSTRWEIEWCRGGKKNSFFFFGKRKGIERFVFCNFGTKPSQTKLLCVLFELGEC